MANLAVAIKEEISRLARKEIKKLTGSTAQAVARYRREIAQLKRAVHGQEKEIAFLRGQERKRIGQPEVGNDVKAGSRYLVSLRQGPASAIGLECCRLCPPGRCISAHDL